MPTPCDQIQVQPPQGASPEVIQCYADAWQFLVANCPGCTGDACKAQLRALYMIWIAECNAIHAFGADDETTTMLHSSRVALMRRGSRDHGWRRGDTTDGD